MTVPRRGRGSLWNNRRALPPIRRRSRADALPTCLALILYEYPFNESIRTMLRLEHLFDRLGQLIARDAPVDHHYALATIFEIMDVGSRADLKSDLLKELEQPQPAAQRLPRQPVDLRSRARRGRSARIDHAFTRLNQLSGQGRRTR